MALLFAFAPDGACQAAALPRRWWSLTPPFQLFPLRARGARPRTRRWESSFLRRFPSGYPAWPLASILPCGARTFLMVLRRQKSRSAPRGRLTHLARIILASPGAACADPASRQRRETQLLQYNYLWRLPEPLWLCPALTGLARPGFDRPGSLWPCPDRRSAKALERCTLWVCSKA